MENILEIKKELIELDPAEKYLKKMYELGNTKDLSGQKYCEERLLAREELLQNMDSSYFVRRGMDLERIEELAVNGRERRPEDEGRIDHYSNEQYILGETYNIYILRHMRYAPGSFHDHDFIEIAYLMKGACTHSFLTDGNETKSHMREGSILIIPPGLVHKIEIYDDSVMVNIMVRMATFHKVFLNNFPEGNPIFRFFTDVLYSPKNMNYILIHTDGDESLDDGILHMLTESEREEAFSDQACDLYLKLWFLAILRHQRELEGVAFQDKAGVNTTVFSILIYIETHFETASLSRIVEEYHFTAAYLNRIFKSDTGMTIQKYITNVKLEKAYEMITGTDMSISEVSEKTGYQDDSFFIKQFRKKYGKTPLQLRKEGKT